MIMGVPYRRRRRHRTSADWTGPDRMMRSTFRLGPIPNSDHDRPRNRTPAYPLGIKAPFPLVTRWSDASAGRILRAGPALAMMEHAQDNDRMRLDPVDNDERAIGDNQLSGSGHPPLTSTLRKSAQAFHIRDDGITNSDCGHEITLTDIVELTYPIVLCRR